MAFSGNELYAAVLMGAARNLYAVRHSSRPAPAAMRFAPNETRSETCGGVWAPRQEEPSGKKESS